MALRMTGLTSGLDTESIVGALMEAHKAKKTKVDNKKTTLEWKQEIWKDLNKKLYSFYTDFAGKLRFQANYMTKKVTSTNSSKVMATANSKSVNGSYAIKVKQLAAAQNVTSGKLADYTTTDENGDPVTNKVTGKTKLKDLGMVSDGSSQIQIKAGKKTSVLTVTDNTTVNDFVNAMKDAGLNASFDEKQGRFFIGSAKSGKDQTFQITMNQLDATQQTALNDLRNTPALNYNSLSAKDQNTVMSALATMQKNGNTDESVAQAVKTIEDMLDANIKAKSKSELIHDKTIAEHGKYLETEPDANGVLQLKKDADGRYIFKATAEADLRAADKWTDVNDELAAARAQLQPGDSLSAEEEEAIRKRVYQKNVNAALSMGDSVIAEYMRSDELKEDIEAELNAAQIARGTTVSDAVADYATALSAGVASNDGASNAELGKLGLSVVTGDTAVAESDAGNTSGMVVIKAADSEVELNGATLTSNSTKMEVNGLTLELTGVTGDEVVNLSVTNDSQGVYDMIKEFANQYNSILSEMNTFYHAKSARGYDPLTDDQKSEMSDDEVEKWEKKIKDSLLRRDSTLEGLISTMRSITATTVKASNGKTYSLASLGISTGKDYKEYGLLHIKGDEDDTDYADEENTLMNLLNEDPSVVTEVLSGITTQLYNTLTKKMETSSLSSALTFYNDKEMNKQLSEYNKDIKRWETKLKDYEDRYYAQFTAMEKALANMQSQQNALSGFFG